ncbi:uncharacterized protein LOC127634114 [Xyrauchen texanus]|uniref:uncharacterized protein LOC127634114 n=1 Tax=Xyrauchen texanus TaxID=154827 RepID=UPI002242AA0C|nr:uncharacterized protein LOC127634114 [Xyrauchen texanus]
MEIQNVLMRSLVVVGVFSSVIWTITDAEKVSSCCKLVSRTEVTDPIIGFRMQKSNPPCVKAVIFKTEKGEFCSDWTQKWVLKKIRQFLSAQRKKIAEERVIEHLTSPTPTTSITDTTLVGRSTQSTQRSTQELTQGSTQELAQGSTQELTKGSTQELTQGATKELTQGSTQELTKGSTKELTQGSTQELTQGSTQELTQGSTQELTQGSTQELTKGSTKELTQGSTKELTQGSTQ